MAEMVAVAAVAGSGEQRGSLVGGSAAAVAGLGEVGESQRQNENIYTGLSVSPLKP